MSAQKDVLVGIGCFVTYVDPNDHKTRILLSQRAGSHGAGTWQLPGGHLEMFEEFSTCAQREIKEETDLDLPIEKIEMVTALNCIMPEEKKHYVTVFMSCQIDSESAKKVKAMEPHKVKGEWEWLTSEQLKEKSPLFSPLKKFVDEIGLERFK